MAVSTSYRGAAGMAKAAEEAAKAEAQRELNRTTARMPFRFFVPQGESREVVVVDDAPDFHRFEHCLQDPRTKRYDVYLPCMDATCNCPACGKSERPPYFAMYLTIIDLTPYINSDDEEVPFTKKLMVVKPMQQKKINRYYQQHGTLRGMILLMSRDSKKDASIGDPDFVDFMSEEDLQTYVSEYTDKEGELHTVYCDEPFAYEELFPDMTEDALRALVGGERSSGSRAADDRALGRGRGRDEGSSDDDGFPGARRVATRRGAAAEEPEDVQYDDEPAPPARRAARPAAAPAAPAARPAARVARAAPAIDPDDNPEAGDDVEPPFDAPTRPAPRGRTAAAPAAPARAAPSRAAPARAAPRPAPEPEAAQPRGNVAARRAQLRR